ncbi:MAG: organomercurial lyase [Nocardioidaceae bacterium]
MATEPTTGMTKTDAALSLSAPARAVHLGVLTTFIETGRPPTRQQLELAAGRGGADPAAVLAELSDRDVVAYDDGGEIRAAYPFSPAPTRIRLSWAGSPPIFAMCAVDALGMSAMLDRPLTIVAEEPDSGRPVTVTVDRRRAEWDPVTSVVFACATSYPCGPSVDCTCSRINFFSTAAAAADWAARHPDVTGETLEQELALARGVAEFGALMRTDRSGSDQL